MDLSFFWCQEVESCNTDPLLALKVSSEYRASSAEVTTARIKGTPPWLTPEGRVMVLIHAYLALCDASPCFVKHASRLGCIGFVVRIGKHLSLRHITIPWPQLCVLLFWVLLDEHVLILSTFYRKLHQHQPNRPSSCVWVFHIAICCIRLYPSKSKIHTHVYAFFAASIMNRARSRILHGSNEPVRETVLERCIWVL